MASSSPGPSPRGHRLTRVTAGLRSRSRTTPSTTETSRARSRRASTGAAPSCSGTAASGLPMTVEIPNVRLRKGDLKFTLAGEKLEGSWVLVRMRHDRERDRSNRNNWLLIKHRDGHERESWRSCHGAGPVSRLRPHHGGDRSRQGPPAKAVHAGWEGRRIRRGVAFESERQSQQGICPEDDRTAHDPGSAAEASRIEDAAVHRASALQAGEPPARRCRLGPRNQARRVPHAAACRRRGGGHADPQRTRLDIGLLLPSRMPRHSLDDCIIDGEVVALDHNGAPDFAALQAASVGGTVQGPDLLRI